MELNQDDCITLPNTITFQDAISDISYDNTEPDQVAVITYTYHDVILGTASLDFTATEKGSSVFQGAVDETTAETSAASNDSEEVPASEAADDPAAETTETSPENVGGIPTATQESSKTETDSSSGGPAVIFINVVKIFFWILGIAVVIFLLLLLRAFLKNYHFAHRSTRLTWRFSRRRNHSRARYRSVNQDLRSRRKEAIREAKRRQKPKKQHRFK